MSINTGIADRYEALRQRDERLKSLLQDCAGRDESAFALLYEETSVHLFRVLMRLLTREELVQECLQDVYLKIWSRAGEYRAQDSAPLTWMSAVARHQAIDILRRQKREVIEADTKGMAEQADTGGSPEAHVMAQSEENELGYCMNQLKPDHRQLFMLAYFRGHSHSELARQLDLPIGTIKTWMRRGLASLKKCMQPMAVSE
jgi:RNA polymerase sigma-70 factor (ECF subfamily)